MDKSLFDKLYFGDYQPNDIIIKSKKYNNLISQTIKIQNKLSNTLSESDYKNVVALCNIHNQLNDFYAHQSYTDGIKFAVNFLYNALCDRLSGKK